jgi:hypothetical protein
MIRHILLIEFKPGVTPQQIAEIKALFQSIPDEIDGVTSVEWGVNNSPEHKNKHFSHAVLMTFADEAARQHYLPHPQHDALKEVFGPLLADIIVFDYAG